MTIFTDGLRVEPESRGVTDYAGSFGASLGATVGETLSDSPVAQLLGIGELERAKGNDLSKMSGVDDALTFGGVSSTAPAVPMIGKQEAADRVKAAGLEKALKLPDQDTIAAPALDIMIDRARERRERETTLQLGPQGILPSALMVGTSFLVGAIDPLNIASAFIPVMGELRYGKLLASAGESFAGRTGVRLGVGGAQGAVGQAALEPLDWYAHTQDGRDFGMADVLHNLVFGAALGGGLHAAGGGIRDVYRSRKGLAQYPFGPGEPMAHVDGIHVPQSVLSEQGVTAADMPEHLRPVVERIDQVLAETPAMNILRDLPPRAQEDSMRAAIASIVQGEPVRVGELLHAAAQTDPRIAESFEAFHGTGYTFDRFDVNRINSGEGAQSYGHGLYFAEHSDVAKVYADALGPKRGGGVYDMDPNSATFGQFVEMSKGNVYKVRINADREHFLDWDRPLKEQNEHVRSKLRAAGFEDHQTGKEIYQSMVKYRPDQGGGMNSAGIKFSDLDATPEAVSGRLSATGIHGIKYLDQGSRALRDPDEVRREIGRLQATLARDPENKTAADLLRTAEAQLVDAEKGTRNFVVFDDKHIEIIDRNGEPLTKPFTESPAGNPKITLADPDLVTAPKPRGRGAAHPDTLSLNEHLASKGGLRPDPELEAIYGGKRGPFMPGFGPLIRKTGMTLDEALSSAKQHGYMFDPHDIDNGTAGTRGRTSLGLILSDLLDHLDAENRGQKLYKLGHVEETKYDPEQEKHIVLGHVEAEIEAAGLKLSDIDGKLLDRTVEIVHREGQRDVLAAYERAIIEDEERYHAIAEARDAADRHPARDVPFDTGAASGGSRADPISGGPAQRTRPGDSGAYGAQSRSDGAVDPGARDAAWRELAAADPDVRDPGQLEASRAADRLPEQVETNLDRRVAAADKADAYARQMYDIFKDRLPEQERVRLEDMIRELDDDAAVRKEAIERSGACLFGARA